MQTSAPKCIQLDRCLYIVNTPASPLPRSRYRTSPATRNPPFCQSLPSQTNHSCEFYHHTHHSLVFELYINGITQYAFVNMDSYTQHYAVRFIHKLYTVWIHLLLVLRYSIIWMCHSLSGYLIQFLAITDNAKINTLCK